MTPGAMRILRAAADKEIGVRVWLDRSGPVRLFADTTGWFISGFWRGSRSSVNIDRETARIILMGLLCQDENEDLREELAALKGVHVHGCECSLVEACKFAREANVLRREREGLVEALVSGIDALNRMMGDTDLDYDDSVEFRAMQKMYAILDKLKREGE